MPPKRPDKSTFGIFPPKLSSGVTRSVRSDTKKIKLNLKKNWSSFVFDVITINLRLLWEATCVLFKPNGRGQRVWPSARGAKLETTRREKGFHVFLQMTLQPTIDPAAALPI